ncbi:glutamyl-tRNA reductase [Gammaproteobacteria bacterium]|nr:glutamyl-tRNA reductase [Gammaproteobacteria bacterium]|tara:strand:- start:142 stop:1374 length:1233 start_codon:yes stop_codon:yes gene_type:complete
MELQLFGINHKTSNVSEREKFIINESNQILLDIHLKEVFKDSIESFYGISTCNRTELYLFGAKNISKEILPEVLNALNIKDISNESFYFLSGHDALVHMCKVASGIDSQVLGEQEIFGQFKIAYKKAKDIKIVGKNLSYLSEKAIQISKKARSETNIGLNSLSVSGLALKLVRNIFENPHEQNVLVVGAGSLAQNVIENLYKKGINKIKSVNRTIRKIKLHNSYEIVSASLDALHDQLENADIVIASSSTELPLIGKGAIENALQIRRNKPMLLIDLGVPRNIEEEIRNIEQAYLFSIDDIEKITQENFGQRTIEAEKAMNIIVLEAQEALDSYFKKSSKDDINTQLETFLLGLSDQELDQFKISKDFSELVKAIKTMTVEDSALNNFQDIKNIEDHVITSMIKRFFDNA